MEISMELLQSAKNGLTYDSAIPLLTKYPKECKSTDKRDTIRPMFTAAVFTIDTVETAEMSELMNKYYIHTHTHHGILLSHKEKWNFYGSVI
jgi:hypothetical protein